MTDGVKSLVREHWRDYLLGQTEGASLMAALLEQLARNSLKTHPPNKEF